MIKSNLGNEHRFVGQCSYHKFRLTAEAPEDAEGNAEKDSCGKIHQASAVDGPLALGPK
jgi:hypothetical protein